MKTENKSIEEFISLNSTSFFIPPFQRAYAWGRSEIERYFSDVIKIIESELSQERDKKEHFFGTLVVKKENDTLTNRSIIVDGQQRLTTTLLMLIALRDSEEDKNKKDHIEQKYLFNNSSSFEDKIKLKQVTKDWDAYKSIVNQESIIPGNITRVYELFKKLIKSKMSENPKITFEHFIIAIRRLNVSIIILDDQPHKGEDPQMIFETLNSLGRPLELSDLIRNFVLLEYDSNNQTNMYEKIWHPKIESRLEESTSQFFRDYLQLKLGTPLKTINNDNTKELYRIFKDYVVKNFDSKKTFIDDILKYVDCYKWIISEVNEESISDVKKYDLEIKELLRNIFFDIKTDAFKPFVIGLLENYTSKRYAQYDDKALIKILKDIRTYLIRRRVVKLYKGENKYLVTCCKSIDDIVTGKMNILKLLSSSFYKLRMPNDNEISSSLKTQNFYNELKKYAKFILGKIEENNTKVSVDFRSPQITIEHVMPQQLTPQWKNDLGKKWKIIHEDYIHNIGNLILTEFNSEMGNKTFSQKKKELSKSSLNYRLSVTKKTKWNENSIVKHQSEMIEDFLSTFPVPEPFASDENWVEKTDDDFIYPTDNEIVENTKPKELHIENVIYITKGWQDLFLKFLKRIREVSESDFESVVENQISLFNRSNIILKWRNLNDSFDENKLKNYKTLDGSDVNLIGNHDDDDIIIHVGITASECLSRISAVIDSLSLSSDYVKIKLK
jgi:uncharacterized protein with ParB-like and HNH nuclease domain